MAAEINRKWQDLTVFFTRKKLTQAEIAAAVGISQSAVSRVLAKCPVRNGSAFKKLCIYADKERIPRLPVLSQSHNNNDLTIAICEVWNGTAEHAKALAALIRAAGQVANATLG